ncbi:MAG: hypothetical protein QXP57_07125 [Nitrososphaerota archaeon]
MVMAPGRLITLFSKSIYSTYKFNASLSLIPIWARSWISIDKRKLLLERIIFWRSPIGGSLSTLTGAFFGFRTFFKAFWYVIL